ncbi:MAG: efflux RND transporter periplasmic adaptor subunit, partial [Gammaproteobacteria bacterium]|nr:efflux RND transporter periplasmic adaptor subunit [Gammaproteobacteria bacterium]
AKRDLDNTRIHAPFNLRIANLSMEMDQYITSGQKLFEGDGVDRSEVVAQVALSSMRNLFLGHQETPPSKQELTEGLAKYADLKATILMDIGDTAGRPAQWEAEFVRFTDNIDSETRTIGVVVALDKPFEKIIPGQRPPLSKGMFVKVLLQGRIQPQQIVVPRSALRNGKVYLLDEQQRLLIHQVEVRYSQNGLSVIQSGIEAGQQLVLSDLVPAIAGMRLQPQVDIRMEQQLVRSTGKSRPGSAR